jgi:hypothetical protein
MRINYIPICYRYGYKPLGLYLIAIYATFASDCFYMSRGMATGLLASIVCVPPTQLFLKKVKAHPVRGSILLRQIQFSLLAISVCGGAIQQSCQPQPSPHLPISKSRHQDIAKKALPLHVYSCQFNFA